MGGLLWSLSRYARADDQTVRAPRIPGRVTGRCALVLSAAVGAGYAVDPRRSRWRVRLMPWSPVGRPST
jgi:hypothetical protein